MANATAKAGKEGAWEGPLERRLLKGASQFLEDGGVDKRAASMLFVMA